jgi:radical SAM protein with 4Fe4S-binding SPASM domain
MALSILEELGNYARSHQLPYHVLLELTYGCNLRCVMCYNPTHAANNELTLEEYTFLFDELARLGTVQLTMTGGEILARPDFFDIAWAARDRHFALRLFTNGTRVDADVARRMAELAPISVEVSLYGGTATTHDAVTERDGSFERTIEGIRHLTSAGTRVVAKSLLTQRNKHEIAETLALVEELRVHFKGFDPVVFANHNGDEGPLDLRVPAAEVAALLPWDLIDSEDIMTGDDQSMCGAGHDFAAVTPHGLVYPCPSMRLPMGNIRERPFGDIWRNPEDPQLEVVRAATWGNLPTCNSCEARALCDRCPGLAHHADGDVLGPSSIHCDHAFAQLDLVKASDR